MVRLNDFLASFKLNQEEIDLVAARCEEKSFKAGEQIGLVNHGADRFYFIQEGMIRSYRLIDGNDITYNFFVEGEVCGDYEATLNQCPSKHYFQAITPTKAMTFHFRQIEELFEEHPRIERIARKMAEYSYLRLLDRVIEFQSESLEQRYLKLVERHESILKDAPLQHIATYLGVKPQSLSRIRAKVVKNR